MEGNEELNKELNKLTREEIDEAIYKILVGGQSYKIGSRSLTRADLGILRNLRKDIAIEDQANTDIETNMEKTNVAIFEGR